MIYHKYRQTKTHAPSTVGTTTPQKFQRTKETPRNHSLSRDRSAISLEHQKFIKETAMTESKLDPDRFFRNINVVTTIQYPEYLKPKQRKNNNYSSHRNLQGNEARSSERKIQQLQHDNITINQRLEQAIYHNEHLISKNKELETQVAEIKKRNSQLAVINDQLKQTIEKMQRSLKEGDKLLISYREQALMQEVKRLKQSQEKKDHQFLSEQISRLAEDHHELNSHHQALQITHSALVKKLSQTNQQIEALNQAQTKLTQLNSKYHRLAVKHVALRKKMSLMSYSMTTPTKNEETLSISSQSSTQMELQQSSMTVKFPKRSVSFPNGL